jgi:hypothetical protein
MSAKTKTFDCVAMKDRVQAELLEEQARMGESEMLRRHREWLQTSDAPLARWWRSVEVARTPSGQPTSTKSE